MSWRDASAEEKVSCELCVVIEDGNGSRVGGGWNPQPDTSQPR